MEENNIRAQLPRLETPQTQHIRESYPVIEYLEDGYVADWLKERKDQLLELAREERSGINAHKLVSCAVLGAGFLFHATSPLAPVGAAIALAGYVHGVYLDANQTGTINPFPFVRGGVLDFLGALGNAEIRHQISSDNEAEALQQYLSPFERKEYQLLDTQFSLLTNYLSQVEPLKRFHAYRWMLDCFTRYKGALPSPEQISAHMVNVQIDTRIERKNLELLGKYRDRLETKKAPRIEDMNKYTPMPDPEVKFITDEQMYSGRIGPSTKLTAINVPSETIPVPQEPLNAIPVKSQAVEEGELLTPKRGQEKRLEEFRRVGESILNSMFASDRSVLLASSSGTGKTTTENYFLKQFLLRNSGAEYWALLAKNDRLFGVPASRTQIFEASDLGLVPLESLLTPLFEVYRIFRDRKKQSTQERERLRKNFPVRLILGDWFGVYEELRAMLQKEELQQVLMMIRQIITIGRDMGVSLFIDTQSANVASLGLSNDASIRKSLDIYSQGFVFVEDGEEKGDLDTIRLVFGNTNICPKDFQEELMNSYQFLGTAIRNGSLKSPIIFSGIGAKPRIGIVPYLEEIYIQPQEGEIKEVVDTSAIIGAPVSAIAEGGSSTIANIESSLKPETSTSDKAEEPSDSLSFDFNKAVEALRSLQGKGWIKYGDARSNSKPLRKATRDTDDVRLLVSLLVKDGVAETKEGDYFQIRTQVS